MEDNQRVVRLPLYDPATDLAVPGYLEIDANYFLNINDKTYCRVVEFQDLVVVPAPTAAQEIDIIDRIISGLPVEYVTPANPEGNAVYKKDQKFKLTDERKSDALIEAANTWHRIPKFDNYEINPLGVIRNRWTKRVLEVAEDGDQKFVAMHDKDGFDHAVNIEFAMEKVYGKDKGKKS